MPSGINSKAYARVQLAPHKSHVEFVKDVEHSVYRYVQREDGGFHDTCTTWQVELGKGARWPYGDWTRCDPSEATHIVVMSYSDYGGSSYDRSNVKALIRDFPRFTCEVYGGHGTTALLISANTGMSETTIGLVDAITSVLSDYPLYDEDHHSQMEYEAVEEAWGDYLERDVPGDLVTRATPAGYKAFGTQNADKHIPASPFLGAPEFLQAYLDDAEERASEGSEGSESSLQTWFYDSLRSEESNSYPYFETATDLVFPEYEAQLYYIAEKILADILADYPPVSANTSDYHPDPNQERMF